MAHTTTTSLNLLHRVGSIWRRSDYIPTSLPARHRLQSSNVLGELWGVIQLWLGPGALWVDRLALLRVEVDSVGGAGAGCLNKRLVVYRGGVH